MDEAPESVKRQANATTRNWLIGGALVLVAAIAIGAIEGLKDGEPTRKRETTEEGAQAIALAARQRSDVDGAHAKIGGGRFWDVAIRAHDGACQRIESELMTTSRADCISVTCAERGIVKTHRVSYDGTWKSAGRMFDRCGR